MRDLSEEAAAEAEAEDGSCGCGRPGLSMTMADWRQSRRGRSGRLGFGESEGWMDRRVATGSSLLGQTKTKRGAAGSAVVAVSAWLPTATGHSRADWWVRCGRRLTRFSSARGCPALRNSGAFPCRTHATAVSRGFYVSLLPSDFLISFINKIVLAANHPVNLGITWVCWVGLGQLA